MLRRHDVQQHAVAPRPPPQRPSESNGCRHSRREQVALVAAVDRVDARRRWRRAPSRGEAPTRCGPCPATTNSAFAAFSVPLRHRIRPGNCRRTERGQRGDCDQHDRRRARPFKLTRLNMLAPLGRDRLDDANGSSSARCAASAASSARRRAEHEEADLVLRYMDDAVEADAGVQPGSAPRRPSVPAVSRAVRSPAWPRARYVSTR